TKAKRPNTINRVQAPDQSIPQRDHAGPWEHPGELENFGRIGAFRSGNTRECSWFFICSKMRFHLFLSSIILSATLHVPRSAFTRLSSVVARILSVSRRSVPEVLGASDNAE